MISIVIPVYNRPGSAIRAARSALDQRLDGGETIEIVLVDDASSPPLDVGVLEHTRIVRLDRNAGPAAARNRGIEACRGEWVAFLDSDDIWQPHKLARQLALATSSRADNDKALLGIACGFYYPNRMSGRLEYRLPVAGRNALEFASGCWIAPGTTLLLHRSAFESFGLFDERLRRLEDYDWLLRFGLAGGRIEVADYPGAVIAPSGLAQSQIVAESARRLEAKYSIDGDVVLPLDVRRRLAAYLAFERGVADLGGGRTMSGVGHLLRSQLLKPRLRGSLLPYWVRSGDVPMDVVARFRELTMPPP